MQYGSRHLSTVREIPKKKSQIPYSSRSDAVQNKINALHHITEKQKG